MSYRMWIAWLLGCVALGLLGECVIGRVAAPVSGGAGQDQGEGEDA